MRMIIDFEGQQIVAREMIGIQGRMTNIRPAAVVMLDQLRAAMDKQFQTEGGYGTRGWGPNSQEWTDYKRRKGFDLRIYHMTLRMRKSLTEASHEDAIHRALRDGFDYGSTVEYLPHWQKNVKKGSPVQLPDAERQHLPRTLQRFMRTGNPFGVEGGRLGAYSGGAGRGLV